MSAEKRERFRRQHKSPGRSNYSNRNWSSDNSREISMDSLDRDRTATRMSNRSRNKSRKKFK